MMMITDPRGEATASEGSPQDARPPYSKAGTATGLQGAEFPTVSSGKNNSRHSAENPSRAESLCVLHL